MVNDVKALLNKIKAEKEAAQNKNTNATGQPTQGGGPSGSQQGGGKAPRIQKSGGRGK